MINEAHIGVGIQGLEGREAAKASDVSLGKFMFLRRLILFNG
jgi:magnesium-transporting ATPase (P-type)